MMCQLLAGHVWLWIFCDNIWLKLLLVQCRRAFCFPRQCFVEFKTNNQGVLCFFPRLCGSQCFVLHQFGCKDWTQCVDNCKTKNPCQRWKDKMDGKNDNTEGPNPRKLYKTTLKSLKDFEPSKPKAEAKVHFWMTKATVEIIWIQQSMPFPSAVFIQAWYELVADETVDPVALNSLIHAFVKARCDVVMWVVSVPQDRNQPQKAYCNNHLISHAQAVRWQRHALVVFGTESLHLPCKGLFFSTHVWDELPLNYPSYRFYRSCFQIVFETLQSPQKHQIDSSCNHHYVTHIHNLHDFTCMLHDDQWWSMYFLRFVHSFQLCTPLWFPGR